MTVRSAVLCAAVLVVNAVILAVEMLATRLLFPHFGNTVFTWSSVISVIIAGLFVGYMAGGMLAERSRDRLRLVFAELLAAGLAVMAVPWLCGTLLVPSAAAQPIHPPLLGCFFVFGLPAALLAAMPPAAVGVLAEEGRGAAWAAGLVSALSAFGSILGTLATVFVLLPAWGVRALFSASGAALGLLALVVWLAGRGRSGAAKALLALAIYGGAGLWAVRAEAPAASPHGRLFFARDSPYQLVRVFEQGEGDGLKRVLLLDSTYEGAAAVRTGDVVFEYMKAYRIFPNVLDPRNPARILFIGGGGYGMPLKAARALPRAAVEVAEVDPVVREVGELFFGARTAPNLTTLLGDGRQVVRARPSGYDGVFVDAYQGVYAIPFHLTTREFFEEVRVSLKPEGFVAVNLIGNVIEREGLLCAVTRTLAAVYPWVRVHPVEGARDMIQNVILVASRRLDGFGGKDPLAGTGFSRGFAPGELRCGEGPLLTDDYAPVEWLVGQYKLR